MSWGKSILLALLLAAFCPQTPTGLPAGEASSIISLRKNATVSVGGEIAVDYSYRDSETTSASPAAFPRTANVADLAVRNATLRIQADMHPNVSAFMKLDFRSGEDSDRPSDEILEEAMLVMSSVRGTGFGFFGGRGRAPYGQDITLGMVQSYHHNANEWDSSEGFIFLTDPPGKPGNDLPLMRPGQVDRVVMAGASYSWQERWKIEAAAFQPWFEEYDDRLIDRIGSDNAADSAGDIGAAGRVWWRPSPDLTVQFSAMAMRSGDMARIRLRTDVDAAGGARGTGTAYAFSAGFDWRRGAWRVFGEYQRGADWNFTKGYDTDTWQLGAAVDVRENWRVGAMAEGLRIDDGSGKERLKHDFYKLALNVRYAFDSGAFVLVEFGQEWMRRERGGELEERRKGKFAGARMGFSF